MKNTNKRINRNASHLTALNAHEKTNSQRSKKREPMIGPLTPQPALRLKSKLAVNTSTLDDNKSTNGISSPMADEVRIAKKIPHAIPLKKVETKKKSKIMKVTEGPLLKPQQPMIIIKRKTKDKIRIKDHKKTNSATAKPEHIQINRPRSESTGSHQTLYVPSTLPPPLSIPNLPLDDSDNIESFFPAVDDNIDPLIDDTGISLPLKNDEKNDKFIIKRKVKTKTKYDKKKQTTDTEKVNKRSKKRKSKRTKIVDKMIFKDGLCKISVEKKANIGHLYKIVEPRLTTNESETFDAIIALFKQTIEYDVTSENSRLELQDTLFDFVNELVTKYNITISERSMKKIYYYLERDIIGYGKIDLLLKDENVEDISCNGSNYPIYIYHRLYENIPTNIKFENDNDLDSFIIRLAQRSKKHISLSQPMVDGRLPDGSRIQCTLQEVTPKGSTFTIRRFKENPLTPIDLIKNKTISLQMASYLWLAVEHGASILYCGGTASGKTTVLNALSLFIPYTRKIVSIEDTRELNIPHQNWIAGITREGFTQGEGNSTDVDMFDLIRAALRQRPQILVVGEVRGKETFIMFQAMATGHTAYSTIHAENLHSLKQRLENPPINLPRVLLTSLDIVLFLKQVRVGERFNRKVIQVVEIVRMDPESNQIMTETPFYWQANLDNFKSSGQSKFLDDIMRKMDWTGEQLEQDLRRRSEIIKKFLNNNIQVLPDFSQIVEAHYRDPEAALALMDIETEIKPKVLINPTKSENSLPPGKSEKILGG